MSTTQTNLTSSVKMALCRVCMQSETNMNDIFYLIDNIEESISQGITYCTGLQVTRDDGLPNTICENCLNNLTVARKFKTLCLESDEIFRKTMLKILVPKMECSENYESLDTYDAVADDKDDLCLQLNRCLETKVGTKREKLYTRNTKPRKKSKIKNKIILKEKIISTNIKINTDGRGKPFWCEQCQLEFKTKLEVAQHKKQHEKKDWICEICGRVFMHKSSHYTHLRAHRPPRYACDTCDYKTAYKHDLVKHLRIHSGLKQYQCEYCTASYYVVSNLRSHIQRCHKKVKNFTCQICNYQFFDKIKMQMHMDSHNDIKRHHCDICGSNFSRGCYLKKHLKKHHGIEPVKVRPGRPKANTVIDEKTEQNVADEKTAP